MDNIEKHIADTPIMLDRSELNHNKIKAIYIKNKATITGSELDDIIEFYDIALNGLREIARGQLTIIDNLKASCEKLKHDININELLKGIK